MANDSDSTEKRDSSVKENYLQEEHGPGGVVIRQDSFLDDDHIKLTWRSWLVVFVACFGIFAQVFVVVAAGSVIAFIVRDVGEPSLAGWIIQAPLLMQSVLSPIVGRLSDVVDRKYLSGIPPALAFVGAVISAKATSMNELIGGGILIGSTLSTISILQAIPSEVLPLKYRALANGFAFMAGAIAGVVGVLGAGGVTNTNPGGWRDIFWMQAAFHASTALGLLLFYYPAPSDYPPMSFGQIVWACDPIGSVLLIAGATLALLALDWAGGAFEWQDAHVVAPLVIGCVLLVVFGLYEWKGRSDGMVAHVFFSRGPNFVLSCFAFAIEGWVFYSAVNSVVPQMALNLGFASDSWHISIRQLSFNCLTLIASIPITWYATRYRDLKTPLLVTFTCFLAVCIAYSVIRPSWKNGQIALNVIAGIGQSGPLTLLVALVQYCSPHQYLATATGLAFSARAIGGAFGSAVLDAIINGKLKTYSAKVGDAAVAAGLPATSVASLLTSIAAGSSAAIDAVPGINSTILQAAIEASHLAYAHAYNLAWVSIIPFIVVAIGCIALLKDVRELMTDHVEATVEHVDRSQRAHQPADKV